MEGQRVRRAGDDLEVGVVAAARDVLGGQRHDHVDHVIDGDDVQDRIGQARELGQHTAAVGHDQRIGDLVAVDPARVGLRHRGFDDRGAHEGDAVPVAGPQLLGDLLGHRLGEGVDVGPAHGLGAGAAEVDQALIDPLAARLLGGGGDGLGAHPAVTALRGADLGAQGLGPAGLGVDPGAGPQRGLVLGAPVDVRPERALAAQPLGDAADVGGGDMDDVRVLARGEERLVEVLRTADVRAEGLVDRRVEGHRGGGVDHHVEGIGDRGHVGEVALEHADARIEDLLQLCPAVGAVGLQQIGPGGEHRLPQQLFEAFATGDGPLGAHHGGDMDIGGGLQQRAEHRLPEEAGHAGEQDPTPSAGRAAGGGLNGGGAGVRHGIL